MGNNNASSSGTLPSNTIPNPRNECKGITTRSGVVLDGPLPPMPPPFVNPDNEKAKETEVTKDQVQLNSSQGTARVQPVPVCSKRGKRNQFVETRVDNEPTKTKKICLDLKVEKDKNRERDDILASKFIEIFRDLHFELSFADALVHMPKFALMIKKLLSNKDKLIEITKTPMNANCSCVGILKSFPKSLVTRVDFSFLNVAILETISKPLGIAENVFVKVGKFYFPVDFVILDFAADPRVPLILGRPFLSTAHALIDVYEGEIILRHDDQSLILKCGDTPTISYDNCETVKRIDLIDATCAEYAPQVLDFTKSGDSTSIILDPPPFTPFEGSEMLLEEEIEEFLENDESLNMDLNDDFNDEEGDMVYLESLLEVLNDDPFSQLIPPKFKKQINNVESVKTSIEEPPDLELKDLPSHLEYAFLEKDNKLPVIISKDLKEDEKVKLIEVLKAHKSALAWKISDIKGIDPKFCTHKILMEDDFKPVVQMQRRVNPKIHEVIKKEVIKLLDAGLIYPISDSPWVSPVHCVPKKGGMTVVKNDDNELIPTRLVTGWRVCIDYRKLNDATRKDHFPLPFMDQMLERLAGNEFYCFLDGFSGYFQIPIDPQDQEKTTFTCPYGTFAYKRMPFGLVMPRTFKGADRPLFHDMIEEIHRSFYGRLSRFLGDIFSKDFSKIARPMTHLLEKETPFIFSDECKQAFDELRKKLIESPILVVPNWDYDFEIMCDASDFALGAVLGQRKDKHFHPIHYASKTMTGAQLHYTTTEKEMLAVVYALEKFRPYLVLSKTIVYTDHSAIKYLMAKQDAKSRIENLKLNKNELEKQNITESFPLESLGRYEEIKKVFVNDDEKVVENVEFKNVNVLSDNTTPWFADLANYHADFVSDQVIRRCVFGREAHEILMACHSGPTGGFPDVGSFMVQKLWKDKAIPTISIDGLQSSLHNLGNLLSLFFIELTSILLACPKNLC
ncbi:reverse transcriptase domain-containing protein [Tanacetum coccineum]|uniref:Reverse transcriptase domain-containing protein n=1 Tax=Tanacetum coccineum TaxID=301880 RepID=A0ABQ5A4X7_9ASTR